jgi:hypothetical protein
MYPRRYIIITSNSSPEIRLRIWTCVGDHWAAFCGRRGFLQCTISFSCSRGAGMFLLDVLHKSTSGCSELRTISNDPFSSQCERGYVPKRLDRPCSWAVLRMFSNQFIGTARAPSQADKSASYLCIESPTIQFTRCFCRPALKRRTINCATRDHRSVPPLPRGRRFHPAMASTPSTIANPPLFASSHRKHAHGIPRP